MKAFVAAVLGGIGNCNRRSYWWALSGLAEVLIVAVEPDRSGHRDAIAFCIMIVILLTRPTGIMGENLPD